MILSLKLLRKSLPRLQWPPCLSSRVMLSNSNQLSLPPKSTLGQYSLQSQRAQPASSNPNSARNYTEKSQLINEIKRLNQSKTQGNLNFLHHKSFTTPEKPDETDVNSNKQSSTKRSRQSPEDKSNCTIY